MPAGYTAGKDGAGKDAAGRASITANVTMDGLHHLWSIRRTSTFRQFHKKAKLDAAGFIRAEENAKRVQTQELDILCYLLYNVYIINIK